MGYVSGGESSEQGRSSTLSGTEPGWPIDKVTFVRRAGKQMFARLIWHSARANKLTGDLVMTSLKSIGQINLASSSDLHPLRVDFERFLAV
jgi:hypothetical protein